MATGKGLICKLGEHIPIEGADKIVQVNMFGETIITSKTNEVGMIGILFDMETCLSHEYSSENNMYRHSNLNKDKTIVGYLQDDRRIRPIKLKGVKVSALFMPISTIPNGGFDKVEEYIGFEIDEFNGFKICEKYVSKATKHGMTQNKEGKIKQNLCPTFREHIDTDQWSRNIGKLQENNFVILTEKLHGTSSRCGYLQVPVDDTPFLDKLITKLRIFGDLTKTKKEYAFVVGSRRVVKSINLDSVKNKNHFYGEDDLWTKISSKRFEGKLKKGETVYFEIVGYTPSGGLIMPSVSNEKLKNFLPKEEYINFIKKYGDTTTFNYGCSDPNVINEHGVDGVDVIESYYKLFVYRITLTNEEGFFVDYSWDQVKNRCEQLGVDYTPELDRGVAYRHDKTDEIYLRTESKIAIKPDELIQNYTDETSKFFPQHIKEGVCVRIENGGMTPILLKNKSFIFKVLEGIIKDTNHLDIEESN